MRMAIELFIDGGVPKSEVGAQINDAQSLFQQGQGKLVRQSMRQGQESHGGPGCFDRGNIGLHESERICHGMTAEAGKLSGQRLARLLAGSHCNNLCMRMKQEQAQQLPTGVTARADDSDFDLLGHFGEGRKMMSLTPCARMFCGELHISGRMVVRSEA